MQLVVWTFAGSRLISSGMALAIGGRMLDVKRVIRRLGETLREMGLLMMVFVPLDALFAEHNVSRATIAGIFIAGAIFVVCGILISESR